ncbi:hypothetical protein [Streptomyces alanosinicus]|uniref:Secreted protein n=1 Tax=Streptomyces alanosinicus TaxID=68171 RepID=A0A918YDS5_9ACTN|nr:hypothetical protein [Streptomyces alanosinicus]GHE00505.1 hypothetical protein GCM10010339_15950 [Streptomyces alanosinicus]
MKRLKMRTARMSVVAGVAAAGLALGLAGAGTAQASPVTPTDMPGFKGGKVDWKANGDTVTVTDTKRDGYAFGVTIFIRDPYHSHSRQCLTSGAGQTKTCHFDYPEGSDLAVQGILISSTDIDYAGTGIVTA